MGPAAKLSKLITAFFKLFFFYDEMLSLGPLLSKDLRVVITNYLKFLKLCIELKKLGT